MVLKRVADVCGSDWRRVVIKRGRYRPLSPGIQMLIFIAAWQMAGPVPTAASSVFLVDETILQNERAETSRMMTLRTLAGEFRDLRHALTTSRDAFAFGYVCKDQGCRSDLLREKRTRLAACLAVWAGPVVPFCF